MVMRSLEGTHSEHTIVSGTPRCCCPENSKLTAASLADRYFKSFLRVVLSFIQMVFLFLWSLDGCNVGQRCGLTSLGLTPIVLALLGLTSLYVISQLGGRRRPFSDGPEAPRNRHITPPAVRAPSSPFPSARAVLAAAGVAAAGVGSRQCCRPPLLSSGRPRRARLGASPSAGPEARSPFLRAPRF